MALYKIASTAIVYKEDKYLIVRRSLNKKAFPGRWTVPGGKLELEDYINSPKTSKDAWYFVLEDSLKREVREETNLEIKRVRYLCDLIFIYPDKTPSLVLSFFSQYKSGKIKLNEENIDYRWASLKELKRYDLISGIFEEIQEVDRILRGKEINKKGFRKKINKNLTK